MANRTNAGTPKPKGKLAKLDKEQIAYLAGFWEGTLNVKNTNTLVAVGISRTDAWAQYMAKTYCGEAKVFTSNRGATFWGWFLTLEERLQILDCLEKANALKHTPASERDKIRGTMTKAINKEQYRPES